MDVNYNAYLPTAHDVALKGEGEGKDKGNRNRPRKDIEREREHEHHSFMHKGVFNRPFANLSVR